MTKHSHIIFDYDGVIVETEGFRRNVLNDLLAAEDKNIKENDKRLVGRKTHHFLKEAFPEMTEKQRKRIREEWRKRRLAQPTPLVAGAKETITYARKHFKIAITTGSGTEAVEQTLQHYGLPSFNAIITGEDFSSSKPDPECYHLALQKLKAKSEEAIIIEDSTAGVRAGKAAGCEVWGIGTYHSEEELLAAGADKYFSDHASLLEALKED